MAPIARFGRLWLGAVEPVCLKQGGHGRSGRMGLWGHAPVDPGRPTPTTRIAGTVFLAPNRRRSPP